MRCCAPYDAAASSFSGDEATAVTIGAQLHAELDGGQTDTAARAEHDQRVTRLHTRHRAQRVIRGSVGHAEGRRRALLDAVGDPGQSLGGVTATSSANAPIHPGARHPIADGEIACRHRRLRRRRPANSLPTTNGAGTLT